MTTTNPQLIGPDLQHVAMELQLFIENTGELYEQWKTIAGTLIAQRKAGLDTRAELLRRERLAFRPWVRRGARRYMREIAEPEYDMTSREIVDETAKLVAEHFDDRYRHGDLDWLGGPKGPRGNPRKQAIPSLHDWSHVAGGGVDLILHGQVRYMIDPTYDKRGRKRGYIATVVNQFGKLDGGLYTYLDHEGKRHQLVPEIYSRQTEALRAVRTFHECQFGSASNPAPRKKPKMRRSKIVNPF